MRRREHEALSNMVPCLRVETFQRSGLAPVAIRVLAVLTALLAFSGVSRAATPGSCGSALAPRMVVTADETNGRASIIVAAPEVSASGVARVDYDGETYATRFDDKGFAKLDITLSAPANTLSVAVANLGTVKCDIAFPEIEQVFRVILRWRDPVRLDMHVIEPFGTEGGDGHVSAARPNPDLAHGLGTLDVNTPAIEEDSTAEQSYVVLESARPAHGIFTYRVDYVSRGATPAGDYCENGKFANVSFDLLTLDHGKKIGPRKYATGVMACGRELAHEVEFQRVK